ncbi:MAG: PDZ domain-containing protein [Gemmatimonadaceae bacterium]
MRFHPVPIGALALVPALLPLLGSPARAQTQRTPASSRTASASAPDPRTVLGFSAAPSGDERDTLGFLVTSVRADGPGARAGIRGGDRLAEINGVGLRLPSAEVGERDWSELLSRRFAREVQKAKNSEEIPVRIYVDGQFRAVTVDLGDTVTTVTSRGRLATPDSADAAYATGSRETVREPARESTRDSGRGGSTRESTVRESSARESNTRESDAARRPVALDSVAEAMRNLQGFVQRVSEEQSRGRVRDALGEIDRQIGELLDGLRQARSDAGTGRERPSEGVRPGVSSRPEGADRMEEAERAGSTAPPERAVPADRSADSAAEHIDSAETSRRSEGSQRAEPADRPDRPERWGTAARDSAARDSSSTASSQWLHVRPVTSEMAWYFGEGSERGLLVMEAGTSWAPIRSGDVILRVNGSAVSTVERLRTSVDQRRENAIDLLRRGRVVSVTLPSR